MSGGVLIKVLDKNGKEIDSAHLHEEPWHVLMPNTTSHIVKEMMARYSDKLEKGIWYKITIEVL